jgi:hypothetical protein
MELAHEVKSAESGQAQIRQDGIKGGITGATQAVIATRGVRDLEVSVLQHCAEIVGKVRVVFDEENA